MEGRAKRLDIPVTEIITEEDDKIRWSLICRTGEKSGMEDGRKQGKDDHAKPRLE